MTDLSISKVEPAYSTAFGYAHCIIDEYIFLHEEPDEMDYTEDCNVLEMNIFTFIDSHGHKIFTLCANHLSQLIEIGVEAWMEEYEDEIDWDMYADDSEYLPKDILLAILDKYNTEPEIFE